MSGITTNYFNNHLRREMKYFLKTCIACLLTAFATFQQLEAQNAPQPYPKETLVARLEKIAAQKKTNIVFDPTALQGITAPPLQATAAMNAETLVRKSIEGTSLSCQVGPDKSIVVSVVDNTKKNEKGRLSGRVTDDKGEPIAGATVMVAGTTKATFTDADGRYALSLGAGTVTLEVTFLAYQKKTITGVQVLPGKTRPLNVVLQEAAGQQLSEVVVTAQVNNASAQGLLLKQRSSISMIDGISAEQIKRTSDNNVAQVLKRVAGVTIQEGKFVTVRGMSERYNNVQLNGSSLPSTEPNRRNFSFDIIPSTLIDNVTVNKTFTPDLPGEFTGGLVQVKTLSIPETKFLSISLGTGGNTESTGKEFQTNKRFAADYLLGEKQQRTWYAGRQEENFAQTLTNAGNMNHFGFDIYRAIPMQSYSVSYGMPFQINEKQRLGVVAAVTYRHEENIETIKEMHLRGRDSLMVSLSPGKIYKFVTAIGAIANVGWKTTNHEITWRNLFNNRFTHTNTERYMCESYGGGVFLENYSTPAIANLKQTQVDGEHKLFGGKLIFTWDADYNTTTRTNPDDRFAMGQLADIPLLEPTTVPPTYDGKYKVLWDLIGSSYPTISTQHLMYNNLNETKKNAKADIEYKFKLLKHEQKLKAGYMISSRKSDFQQQYLHAYYGTGGGTLQGMSLQEFYDPANFTSGKLVYKMLGYSNRLVDYYEGKQTLRAWYIMADLSPFKPLHLIGGLRAENNSMDVRTTISSYSDSENKVYISLDSLLQRNDNDLLPSLTLIYALTPQINLRAAYSQTLARPDFRELSKVTYYNVSERINVSNRTAIKQTTCKNYDLRWEWYPKAGEILSVSGFYKKFINPVEKISRVKTDQQNYDLFIENLDQAVIKGIELNFRKSFDFLSPALKDLWISGNGTILEGNVKYSLFTDTVRNRPLQGLATYNVNGSLSYEGEQFGAAVNYTRVGRTLVMGGASAKYDEYENPRDVLDFQFSARLIKRRMEVKLNVSDLLHQDVIVYRNTRVSTSDSGVEYLDLTSKMDYNPGDYIMSRISKGVNYSLSVSYKF